MSDRVPHPLPVTLMNEAEALMGDLPDREDTVYKLRRFMGRVYAIGHQDGRMAASTEAYYDRNAPSAPPTAPLTPEQPPADHGDGSGAGGREGA